MGGKNLFLSPLMGGMDGGQRYDEVCEVSTKVTDPQLACDNSGRYYL